MSSFSDIHGTKWNDALTTIHELEEQFDTDLLVERAEEYVGKNVGVFKAALGNTGSACNSLAGGFLLHSREPHVAVPMRGRNLQAIRVE